jgi:hypothetical protein
LTKFSDSGHPFFRPLWRRVAVTTFVAAWFALEAYQRDGLWIVVSAGMLGYAIWTFFLNWPKDDAGGV